jgi:hypothetical protein
VVNHHEVSYSAITANHEQSCPEKCILRVRKLDLESYVRVCTQEPEWLMSWWFMSVEGGVEDFVKSMARYVSRYILSFNFVRFAETESDHCERTLCV